MLAGALALLARGPASGSARLACASEFLHARGQRLDALRQALDVAVRRHAEPVECPRDAVLEDLLELVPGRSRLRRRLTGRLTPLAAHAAHLGFSELARLGFEHLPLLHQRLADLRALFL